jgi:hypothetical protein
MVRLGELLIAGRRVTPAELEDALENQVLHGGRLGTNLLELGVVTEAELAQALGRQHNLPHASGEMTPDPRALAVADARFYDDEDVLPMRIDATRLTVAVLHPMQMQALEVLAFRASKRVVAVVIPELRMHQLLRRYARAFRPARSVDVRAERPLASAPAAPTPAKVEELINEEDFARLYVRAPAPRADEADVVEGEIVEGQPLEAEMPVVSGVSVEPDEVEPPPLTFAEAQRQLQTSAHRDDIARAVLRFARGRFARAVILNVQGELATGWMGLGQGVSARSVQRISVSLGEPSPLAVARDLRSHVAGPVKRTAAMEAFYAALGGAWPATALLLPVLVRDKPVQLVYVDQGPGQPTPPDAGELFIVTQAAGRSYEALIRARKAARGG